VPMPVCFLLTADMLKVDCYPPSAVPWIPAVGMFLFVCMRIAEKLFLFPAHEFHAPSVTNGINLVRVIGKIYVLFVHKYTNYCSLEGGVAFSSGNTLRKRSAISVEIAPHQAKSTTNVVATPSVSINSGIWASERRFCSRVLSYLLTQRNGPR
jgi:hypothetical protein